MKYNEIKKLHYYLADFGVSLLAIYPNDISSEGPSHSFIMFDIRKNKINNPRIAYLAKKDWKDPDRDYATNKLVESHKGEIIKAVFYNKIGSFQQSSFNDRLLEILKEAELIV